jgi:hypothetical protein
MVNLEGAAWDDAQDTLEGPWRPTSELSDSPDDRTDRFFKLIHPLDGRTDEARQVQIRDK